MAQVKFYRVSQLPATGEIGGIYFLTGNTPTLYIYTPTGWENYASGGESTAVDLAGYALTSWVTEQLNKIWNYLDWDSDAELGPESLPNTITEVDIPTLTTTDKTVTGSINEINDRINAIIAAHPSTVTVTINCIDLNGNLGTNLVSKYENTSAQITDVTSGNVQTVTVKNGQFEFQIPRNHAYKIKLVDIKNYYPPIENNPTFAPDFQNTHTVDVEVTTDYMFFVMSNGRIITRTMYNKSGFNNLTPIFLRVSNQTMETNNGAFYINIPLAKQGRSALPSCLKWGNSEDNIPSLPEGSAIASMTPDWDMERNTDIIINHYKTTDIAAYVATTVKQSVNNIQFRGLLGTAFQFYQILAITSTISEWFGLCGVSTDYLTNNMNVYTSSEAWSTSTNGIKIWIYWMSSSGSKLDYSPKVRGNALNVLPFYKVHNV